MVPDDVLDRAERAVGAALPPAWRRYLRRERWLRRGRLASGRYVEILGPDDALALLDAWAEAAELHPGFYPLGGDGSRNLYCVDLRSDEPEVLLTDIVSSGWADCEPLGLSVAAFVRALDEGTLTR